MKIFHRVTLPLEQAQLWHEVAKDCGLFTTFTGTLPAGSLQVTVKGTEEEIDIAWQLYVEKD